MSRRLLLVPIVGVVTACAAGGTTDLNPTPIVDSGVDTSVSPDSSDASTETGPTCKASEKLCSGKCVDVVTDKANCGACGTACKATDFCVDGKCRGSCPAPSIDCGGKCTSTDTDNANCGACGVVCKTGEVCSAGKCGLSCAPPLSDCVAPADPDAGPEAGGSRYCANLKSDHLNCGTCGTVCKVGETCEAGKCVLSCGGGSIACGGVCVDTKVDPANCGACGTVCKTGEVCSAGTCATSCGGGTKLCSGVCVDTKVDPSNCGACGTTCKSGEVCSASVCTSSCGGGTTLCSGICRDTKIDPANCGSCGATCATGEVCSGGTCGLSCAGGTTKCGTSCVDTTKDPANCGLCGKVCGTGEVCSGGTCSLTCAGGTTKCGTSCVDTKNDPANCGGCGIACASGLACVAGVCSLSCTGGTTKCGSACVDTTKDPANCGGCGTVCTGGAVCVSGSCSLTCVGGTTKCGSACVDIKYDPYNCGGCGIVCGSGKACVSSVCLSLATRFDGTTGTTWEVRTSASTSFYAPGWSDYSPSGYTNFYAIQNSNFARYDTPSNAWTTLTAPPASVGLWPGPAWVGTNLYILQNGAAYRYSISGGTWSTPVASGIAPTMYSMNTHDDSGKVYAMTSDGTNRIVIFDTATNSVTYQPGPTGSYEPRLGWDPVTKKIYIAPAYYSPNLYSYDPATTTVTARLSIPDTGMNDAYCSDRSGHIYAAGGSGGCSGSMSFWQYTTSTNTWKKIPDMPFDHGCDGACTVTDDGWLYATDGDYSKVARIKLN